MATKQIPGALDVLLDALDRAFDKKSWHGTNLRGSIRGLTAAEASARLAPGRHTIAELVAHAAYWKYAVRRRILEQARGSFALKGSDWFAVGDDEASWRAATELLAAEHRALREAVASLPPHRLLEVPRGSRHTFQGLIEGAAAHDLYHAGQIQLLKKLI